MATGTVSPSARVAGAFSGEYWKLRSFPPIQRTMLLGLVVVIAVATFGVVQTMRYTAAGQEDQAGGFGLAAWPMLALHFGQVIPILLGAWVFGQDTATGPRRVTFLASARRLPLAAVKLATVVLVTGLAGLVCTIGALVPLLFSGAGADGAASVDLSRYGWLIGYWVLIGLVAAGLTAGTRSLLLGVVPLVAWAVGMSDLLVAQLPALEGSLDQVFKAAYQAGVSPSASELAICAAQVIVVLGLGVAAFARRDSA